jgi:translation initiation factor 1 (eIF-1/SUI1)
MLPTYRGTRYWTGYWILVNITTKSATRKRRKLGNPILKLSIECRRGKAPKINIVLEKRQGRKTVTRIWGLEQFFLDPNELADELRNVCATSASVGGQFYNLSC